MSILRELNTSLPFLAGPIAWTNIFTYQVPSSSKIVVTHFGNYMATADWSLVIWRIRKNGVPYPPYEAILDQIGISTLPRLTEPIVLSGGDSLQIDIQTLVGAVANDIGITLRYEEGF